MFGAGDISWLCIGELRPRPPGATPQPSWAEMSALHDVHAKQLRAFLDPAAVDKVIYRLNMSSTAVRSTHSARRVSSMKQGLFRALPYDVEGFAAFLVHCRCLGVLMFWKESRDYALLADAQKRTALAERIIERYLTPGAEWELTLLDLTYLTSGSDGLAPRLAEWELT